MPRNWWPKSWRFLSTKQSSRKLSRPSRFRPQLEALEDRLALSNVFLVSNTNDANTGSLRQAILDSNATAPVGGPNVIDFSIGSGVQTISLASALPTITNSVIINGASQPGFSNVTNVPLIVLNGSGAGAGANGLTIAAANSTVEGLVIDKFSGDGILLQSGGNDTLTGNYIGVDSTGAGAAANGIGVVIYSAGNVVGGTSAAALNVISANTSSGVALGGSGASGNTVEGNYIGTTYTGKASLANGNGVVIFGGAASNVVGGTTAAARNIISDNTFEGVALTNSGTGNVVEGNYIGTDVTGKTAQNNGDNGVYIYSSSNNAVGGTVSGAGNVISDNTNSGVYIIGGSGNAVQGNLIGTQADGKHAAANTSGVYISGSTNNTIGGTASGALNVISANTFGAIIGGNGSTGNVVEGNYIGTQADGTHALANVYGVLIFNSAANNTVGGTAVNVISDNTFGVLISGSGTAGNAVQGNYIGTDKTGKVAAGNTYGVYIGSGAASNTVGRAALNVISANSFGVYIDGNNSTGNVVQGNYIGTDVTGAAKLANTYGVSIADGAATNTVGGTTAAARNVISGNTNVGVYIASTGGSGNVLEGNYIGTDVTGTVGLGNGTVLIPADGVFIAASGNIVGGSLPGAGNVISANTGGGVFITGGGSSVVEGNYIGTDKTGANALSSPYGVYINNSADNTIGGAPSGALNVISGNTYGVVIGGVESEDNVVQGNYIGTQANGTSSLANTTAGVFIFGSATNNTIGGTALNVISDNYYGVLIEGSGTTGNVVEGNYIGTDKTGTVNLGNHYGVYINSANNLVGGTASGAGNTISANTTGVYLVGTSATGNTVQGNYIGIQANGTGKLANTDGVYIDAGAANNEIGGTVGGALNVISANTQEGILITGLGTGNVVQGNYIGTDYSGTIGLGNGDDGVYITSANNVVGGSVAGASNVISANTNSGVYIIGGSGNAVQGNNIGTDYTGSNALGNVYGVYINGAANSTVGGTALRARNVISANTFGVVIGGSNSTNDKVLGNYIGTAANGIGNLANTYGVYIYNSAANNTVGGTATGARNVISANTNAGVEITGSGVTGNVVQGNYVGTDRSGINALGNGTGVYIYGSANNVVGGTASGAGNVISANAFGMIVGGSGATGNLMQGNYIGTQANGIANLGNTGDGVYINSANNAVGGTAPGAANIIGFNKYDGVQVDTAAGNAIRENSIHDSGHLGIELINNGNNNQAPPIEIAAATNTTYNLVSIQGKLTSSPNPSTTYAIDFFASPTANPSGAGEGQLYLGSDTVTTNASGTVGFTVTFNTLTAVPVGYFISATATDVTPLDLLNYNDTSAFATNVKTTANLFVVTNTSDNGGVNPNPGAGTGTLRQAIVDANAATGTSFIDFDINAAGAQTINLAAALPTIANTVIINGSSQAVSQNENVSTPLIVLNGSGAGAGVSGLTLVSNNTFVEDLAIDNFSADGVDIRAGSGNVLIGNYIGIASDGETAAANNNGVVIENGSANNTIGGTTGGTGNVISDNTTDGVYIVGSGTTGNVLQGNYIGTDYTGTTAAANPNGVYITSANNTVGGTDPGSKNVISGNTFGVVITSSGAIGNAVQGNYIGTDHDGDAALGNTYGVYLSNATNNTVGGTTAGSRNVISANLNDGVYIISGSANAVQGNYIGTGKNGTQALGNGTGVFIGSSTGNVVGGTAPGAGNVIAFSEEDGVQVNIGTGNAIRQNSIHDNSSGLGIDLTNGGNNNQIPPTLNSANASGNSITIQGQLLGFAANTSYILDFFATPSNTGLEGQQFLGTVTVTTNGSGTYSFWTNTGGTPISFNVPVPSGYYISATATDPNGNTSEFSGFVQVS